MTDWDFLRDYQIEDLGKMRSKKIEIVRTTTWSAGPGCHGGCGVLAYIEDNKLIKIEGDPNHPWNQGRLCARALAMTQYTHHPDRRDPRSCPTRS